VVRAVRLRCPRCGTGPLFEGWLKMHERCPNCLLNFEREHGFFVGAIYINYALTVLVALASFYALELFTPVPFAWRLACAVVCAALFPLVFYRYSKSFWLSLDWFVDPEARASLRRAR
jgi:uncharacterized protein (DUF983 family)